MGFLSGLVQRKSDGPITSSLELFREIYGGRASKTGKTVNLMEAIRCATAMACARVIARGIAQVPLKLFQESSDGQKQPARGHPLYRLLHRKPNPWQTSYEFRETLGLHLVFAGNAYCYRTMVGGVLRELIPFEPNRVSVELEEDGITLKYKVRGKDGQTRVFTEAEIWHLKGPSWCGWQGMDALDLAREAIGLSIATEESQAGLHANGVRTSGVYSVEGELDEDGYKLLRKFLKENHAGEKSGLPMILDRAAKWLPTAMSGVDAQHLETRRFQVEEVCRAMNVMPIMVFSSDKATTYASSEAMYQAHVVHTLADWWERIEQSIDCNLLTEADADAGIYAKYVGQALMRGSMKDRGDYYSKALGSGGSPAWMTPDEVRSLEEMNPLGGDAAKLPVATNIPKPAPAAAVPAGA
jgi:HK97 family phage portal protein